MERKFEGNVGRGWFRVRNPLKTMANGFFILLLKYAPPIELKNHAYRLLLGTKIGKDVAIAPDVMFDPMFPELIELGDGCLLGWGVRVFTHEYSLDRIRIEPVKLGKKVFLGGFSIVRPGVSISDGVAIASCSFVNKSITKKGLYGGVPVKLIRKA